MSSLYSQDAQTESDTLQTLNSIIIQFDQLFIILCCIPVPYDPVTGSQSGDWRPQVECTQQALSKVFLKWFNGLVTTLTAFYSAW